MRRTLFIAALVLSLSCWQAWGQRGGGHGGGSGGGHAGGFGGGHAGGFSGGHAFSGGPHSFSGARSFGGVHSGSGFAGRSFARGSNFARPGLARGFARNHSRVGVQIRSYPYGYGYGYGNCWGGYCGWGGYGYPYLWGGIDPYWWWEGDNDNSDSGYDASGGYDYGPQYDAGAQYDPGPQYNTGLANQMNQQGLVPWRTPQDRDSYARAPQHQQTMEASPATVLVFRDQHKEEIQNYAIVGETIWTFSSQRTERIPLSDLDIPATQKANDDRGVEFRLPGTGEGQ